ncbi:DUF397 domain-containing protein [Streptomyces harbinensis]|uniref:DUF397 domain-containing protein n=1 Tax=Streptomyces harbinensis TaxID=1176198 RepID=UPI0036944FEB
MTTAMTWFKSSHSSDNGGACIEVAFDWRKSSYSGDEGGNCVEVARCPGTAVHIRDSKNPAGPILTVSPDSWSHFTASVTRTSD